MNSSPAHSPALALSPPTAEDLLEGSAESRRRLEEDCAKASVRAEDARLPPARKASVALGFSKIVSSQLLLALGGVLCLPWLARNLGPLHYGRFSLFLTLLGVVANLDFARPLVIRRLASREVEGAALGGLLDVNALFLLTVAATLGVIALPPLAAVGLVAGSLLHARSSRHFSRLSAAGMVATATFVRNSFWLAAALAVTALSFVFVSVHTYVWAFVAATAATFAVQRRLARGLPAIPRAEAGERALALGTHGSAMRDLVCFSASAGVIAAGDRLALTRSVDEATAGAYIAQSDLALKLNALQTALGAVLYPVFARSIAERGQAVAAGKFVAIASWVAGVWFAGILGLVVFDSEVVRLVLGADFAGHSTVFLVCLVCVFVQVWGFLITPWQRARGEFAASRRAYGSAALLVAVLCVVLVPRFGTTGAIAAYATARGADVALLVHELRHLPAGLVGRGRLAALAGMFAVLAGLAAWKILGMDA